MAQHDHLADALGYGLMTPRKRPAESWPIIETDATAERGVFVRTFLKTREARTLARVLQRHAGNGRASKKTALAIAFEFRRIMGLQMNPIETIKFAYKCPDLCMKIKESIDEEIPF